jgi:alpha-tubulin suppressor-like RCC1 family protein
LLRRYSHYNPQYRLTGTGAVVACGYNGEGQLGLVDSDSFKYEYAYAYPIIVESLEGKNVDMVACGAEHNVAISSDTARNRRATKQLLTWGR